MLDLKTNEQKTNSKKTHTHTQNQPKNTQQNKQKYQDKQAEKKIVQGAFQISYKFSWNQQVLNKPDCLATQFISFRPTTCIFSYFYKYFVYTLKEKKSK